MSVNKNPKNLNKSSILNKKPITLKETQGSPDIKVTNQITNKAVIKNVNYITINKNDSSSFVKTNKSREIEEINKMIDLNKKKKKIYSRTYVEQQPYKPLSLDDKKKFLEEFSSNSDRRLIFYSELFNEIKNQIDSISQNLSQAPLSNQIRAQGNISSNREFLKDGFKLINEENETELEPEVNRSKLFILKEKNSALISKQSSKMFTSCVFVDERREIPSIPISEYKCNNLANLNKVQQTKIMNHNRNSFVCARNALDSIGCKLDIPNRKDTKMEEYSAVCLFITFSLFCLKEIWLLGIPLRKMIY